MVECDKCGSQIRDTKYPWYSYYSPKGEATSVLFRYCNESKRDLQKLYEITDDYFGRASSDIDEKVNRAEYLSGKSHLIREALK